MRVHVVLPAIVLMIFSLRAGAADSPKDVFLNDSFVSGIGFLSMPKFEQMRYVAGVVDGYDLARAVANSQIKSRGRQDYPICKIMREDSHSSLTTITSIAVDYVKTLPTKEKDAAVSGAIIVAIAEAMQKGPCN